MSDFDFYTPNPIKKPTSHARRKKMPKWKRFLRRYGFYFVSALILAAVVLGIVLICRSCSKAPEASSFNGTYYIDDYMAYEFDGKGKGAMCLGDTTRYAFDYVIKDDGISFDFEDSRVKDAAYSFSMPMFTTRLTVKEMYMYDELKRSEGDNPTLGIVLCADTDEDIAKYSILHGNEQLFASKYKLYLPTEEELRAEIEAQKAMFYLKQKETENEEQ